MYGRNTSVKQTKRPRSRSLKSDGSQSSITRSLIGRDSPPSYLKWSSENYRSQSSSPISMQSGSRTPLSSDDECLYPYAGAKFSSPPAACVLPMPPMSWLVSSQLEQVALHAMTSHLRQILKVSG